MSNSFGKIFTFTSWGESHGKSIGCVVDGVPAGIELSEQDIQPYLDERKTGKHKLTSTRKEEDSVEILSGIFKGKTTGAPISLIIYNNDARNSDYEEMATKFRPSHGDFTYYMKYKGCNDYLGGGRSSARETAMRVAVGAIARKIIPEIKVISCISQIGEIQIPNNQIDFAYAQNNDLYCGNPDYYHQFYDKIANTRKNKDSIGGVISIIAKNIPVGLGEPIYNKIDAAIASGMMSINAVKAVEIGAGFASATMSGKNYIDEISYVDDKIEFLSNNSGGILAGITTGQDITVQIAIKPTSSIPQQLRTIDKNMENCTITTTGRHDPCIAIRATKVAEAMMYIILADFYLLNKIGK
jgi:chorismate synthase